MHAFRSARFEELGAHEVVTLRIVVQQRTFDPQDGYEWRSFKVDGLPEGVQLANLLRGVTVTSISGATRSRPVAAEG